MNLLTKGLLSCATFTWFYYLLLGFATAHTRFPQWKMQVETRLSNEQARFEDFLSAQWQPHRNKFNKVLEALVRRLQKHITTAPSRTEDYHFHQLLCSTNIEDWYIVPFMLLWGKFSAAIAERNWWHEYRR